MKIAAIELTPYAIPFVQPRDPGTRRLREGLLVALRDTDGLCGYGEIAPLPGYSPETLSEAREAAETLRSSLLADPIFDTVEKLVQTVTDWFFVHAHPPAVVFGFETALSDLAARAVGLPLWRWLGGDDGGPVPVNGLLSGDLEQITRQFESTREYGFTTWKLKVGSLPPRDEVQRVTAVRRLIGPNADLRLDANASWTYADAQQILTELRLEHLDYVEEPLRPEERSRLSELAAATGVQLTLDETVIDFEEWHGCLSAVGFAVAVFKPTLAGGLFRVWHMARYRADQNTRVAITSTLETGIGLAACWHLAVALKRIARIGRVIPCGLATLDLLEQSGIEEELPIVNGHMSLPDGPGLGVTPNRELYRG
ncbi:MAG: o-succinylbenzoate synthase [bacterium]